MEKGNVTEAKVEETESEPEEEEKADDASTKNSNKKTNPPLNLTKITNAKGQIDENDYAIQRSYSDGPGNGIT